MDTTNVEERVSIINKENQMVEWNEGTRESLLDQMTKMINMSNQALDKKISKIEASARANNILMEEKMNQGNKAIMDRMQEDKNEYKVTLQGIAAMTAKLMALVEKN